jgi:hypothetical protein
MQSCVEGLEGAVRHETQLTEEWPVQDRRETTLTDEIDDLVEADALPDLNAQVGKQLGVGVDSLQPHLDSPRRPLAPVPTGEAKLPDPVAHVAIVFENPSNLSPALPVAADVDEAVGLLGSAGFQPGGSGIPG